MTSSANSPMNVSSPGADPSVSRPASSMNWWPYITGLALIIVELCWIVPWYRTVIQISYVASPLRATLVLGSVMLIAYSFSYLFEYARLLNILQRVVMFALFVVCLVFGARLLLNAPAFRVINGMAALDPGG